MRQQVAGHGVFVRHFGEGAARAMYLHCSLASHKALMALARARREPAVLCDLPGHGDSADWAGQGDYSDAVTAIATALWTGPMHLIGHSFGATVALRLAAAHPDKVTALTLIEPVLFAAARDTAEWARYADAHAAVDDSLKAGRPADAAAHFHGLWGSGAWDSLPDAARAKMAARIHLIPLADPAIVADAPGVLADGVLEAITCPVTLIRGAASHPVVAAIHRGLQDRISQATDHVVLDADHMVPITHAKEVAKIMETALGHRLSDAAM